MFQHVIGIDFDNTIVSYDEVFHRVCTEKGFIGPDTPVSKAAIRDRFIADGLEDAWTEIQGYVYGVRIAEALPFPGVEEALQQLCDDGCKVLIISHRTKNPYRGPEYDLHTAARAWLDASAIPHHQSYFELTVEEKIARIADCQCAAFVDDLPAVLQHRAWPKGVAPLLFGPPHEKLTHTFSHWDNALNVLRSALR